MQLPNILQRTRIPALAIVVISTVYVSRIAAQETNPSTEQVRIVNAPQRGAPPSGPYPVVVEHDQRLATHTVYRPTTLGPSKHPVLVWGEGGCAKNGLTFPEFLAEIASYGFVVVADGPPVMPAARGGQGGAAAPAGPERGQAPAANAPRGGQAGAPAPRGQGRGAARGGINADGTPLIAAIDWLAREAADSGSRFYQRVDTTRVAAMGMSCGGLMAYNVSADPRIATVGIWNSGLLQPDEKIFAGLHSPVIIVTGGESDIAYANGKRDFETMPARVPVFYGYYPSIGHGGTYNEDNGGAFGVAAVAWLNWQLMDDTGAKGKGYFVGSPCGLCADSQWRTDSRSLR
jgi:dienelactone hydrolase